MSERQQLLDKYEGINAHYHRLLALGNNTGEIELGERGGHSGMPVAFHPSALYRSLVADLIVFWHEMCKLNDQAVRRTGRPIDKHMHEIGAWHQWLRDHADQSQQPHLKSKIL